MEEKMASMEDLEAYAINTLCDQNWWVPSRSADRRWGQHNKFCCMENMAQCKMSDVLRAREDELDKETATENPRGH
uniref:Uncharacterized protein n=1 Tax=Ditylenchus dipsaci TaxID=166011 RepID=A0A915EE14_9BILA